MMRKLFYLSILSLLTFGNITSKAQNTSQNILLRDVVEICGTGNHEPADCQLLRQAAQDFEMESLNTLANLLEGRMLDNGNSQTLAAINDLLSYSEQHFGQVSIETVACRRRQVSVLLDKNWEKTRQLAEENEKSAVMLLKKHPKNKSIKLLNIAAQLDLLTILNNRNQDDPEHWAKIIQIEKELESYLTGTITYTPDLVDCCQMIANFKANTSTWPEYVNRLIHETFPDGTYLEGNLDGNGMFSNALAFMQHALEGASTLWNERDIRRINVASNYAALQMRNNLAEFDTLHDNFVVWHTFLQSYLPKGDPLIDQIQVLMWECDVRYGQKLYEIRSPYPMLYRLEDYYGKSSPSYIIMLMNLTNVIMMVNAEKGKALIREMKELINIQCQSDEDLYGWYLMAMHFIRQALVNQDPLEYQSSLISLTEWYKHHHRATWESVFIGKNIANLYLTSLLLPDKAAELFSIVKEDVKQLTGIESIFYVNVLEFYAGSQIQSQNYDTQKEGVENFKKLIALKEKLEYPTAQDYYALSSSQFNIGEKEDAIQALRHGILKSNTPEDRFWRCILQLTLGWRLYSDMHISISGEPRRLFEEAIPYFKNNIAKVEGISYVGFSLISYYYNAIGQDDKAEINLKEGMEFHEAHCKQYDLAYMKMLNDLYTLYAQIYNDYDKAEEILEGKLEKVRQTSSFPIHSVILNLLWIRYRLLASKTDDWMLLNSSLNEIQTEVNKICLLSDTDASQRKALTLPVIYEYANLLPLLGRYLKEINRHGGHNIPGITNDQIESFKEYMPALHQSAKDYWLKELIEADMELKKYGKDYLDKRETVSLYTALANYYIGIENDTLMAESYYKSLLESSNPFNRLRARTELASLNMQQGHYEQAALYYEQLKHETANTPQAMVSLEDQAGYSRAIGDAYFMCGRYKDAIPIAREYFRIRQQQVAQNFDMLTQSEREAFIRNGGDGGGGIIFLLPKYPELLAMDGYNAMLASKGLLLRASERIKRGIMNSGDKELQVLTDSLNQLTTRFKAMNTMTDWVHGNYNYEPEVVKIRQQIEALERSINRQASKYIDGMNTTDWQHLQIVMNQGEAAVEYVLSDSASLGALVLLPKGNPIYVPLTPTNELWNAIMSVADMDGFQKAETLYVQDQLHLYDKLWRPMEAVLHGVKTVYYSPTGFLNDLAFAALKCDNNIYLADRYELHQMLSTGDLIALRTDLNKKNVKTASLYGSVFYSPEHEKEAQNIAEVAPARSHRGAVRDAFDYLPFTKYEVRQVEAILQRKQVKANILTGFSSTEESLHAISEHSPDILHLSTHGFFVKGDKEAMENKFLSRFPSMRFSSMQRSGLAFVDANQTWEGATNKPEESDGILTANEVALLDLSHTRLAVLSACQTAVGEYTMEGVYGMHRGFKQAGVKSILASLWNVNDKSTARLMEFFYEKWLSGIPMQQSLNEAIRELRKDYPSPFYWAPFVLMDAEN